MKYTGINSQTVQDEDLFLPLEDNFTGGISSVMGNRYVELDENKKILYIDANNLYAHSMSQPLLYDESKFDKNIKVEDILNSPIDSDIGYFIEVDLTYPGDVKKQKTSHLLLKAKFFLQINIMNI